MDAMRSAANIKGHPIHPMLIAFPIAFLVGAFVCDVVGVIFDSSGWWTFGAWLAASGIVTGLVAAIPGVIDYIYTIPPGSSAKKRATMHMIVNVAAITLFAIAWIMRGGAATASEPAWLIVGIELIALGLLTSGGWMGGTLVYRNLIAVDHRYAESGKWNEAAFERTGGPIEVAKADELEVNQMKLLRIGDERIVLGRTDDGYVAFQDGCSHRGGSLAGGVMICGQVQCLWHGSQFDTRTGAVRCGPAHKPISTYRIEERDGAVHLIL